MKRISLFVLLIFSANILIAQNTELKSTKKQDFLFGAAVGGGHIILKEGNQASENHSRLLAPNFKVGWMLSPRMAVFGYIPTGVFKRNGEQRAFEAVMPVVQYWISDKYWILGGVGVNLDVPLIGTDGEGFYSGPAVCIGTGIDVLHKGRFVIDLQTRYQYGSADIPDIGTRKMSGFDLLVGFNWY